MHIVMMIKKSCEREECLDAPTVLPNVYHFIKTADLSSPKPNQLGMSGAKMKLISSEI